MSIGGPHEVLPSHGPSSTVPRAVVDRGSVATTADSGHCWHAVGPAGEARS